jgi:hypothetical protein
LIAEKIGLAGDKSSSAIFSVLALKGTTGENVPKEFLTITGKSLLAIMEQNYQLLRQSCRNNV